MSSKVMSILAGMDNLDWNDLYSVKKNCDVIIAELLSNKKNMLDLIDNLSKSMLLKSMSERERDNYFDKFVLYLSKDSDVRLRLHILNPDNDKRVIHNHRSSFYIYILRGGYEHVVYNFTDNILKAKEILIQSLTEGDSYIIHHDTYHELRMDSSKNKSIITLMIKGPKAKDTGVDLTVNEFGSISKNNFYGFDRQAENKHTIILDRDEDIQYLKDKLIIEKII